MLGSLARRLALRTAVAAFHALEILCVVGGLTGGIAHNGVLATAACADGAVRVYRRHRRVRRRVVPPRANATYRALKEALDDGFTEEGPAIVRLEQGEAPATTASFRNQAARARWRAGHPLLCVRAVEAARVKLGRHRLTEDNQRMVSEFIRRWLASHDGIRDATISSVFPTAVTMYFIDTDHDSRAREVFGTKGALKAAQKAKIEWKPNYLSSGSDAYRVAAPSETGSGRISH